MVNKLQNTFLRDKAECEYVLYLYREHCMKTRDEKAGQLTCRIIKPQEKHVLVSEEDLDLRYELKYPVSLQKIIDSFEHISGEIIAKINRGEATVEMVKIYKELL